MGLNVRILEAERQHVADALSKVTAVDPEKNIRVGLSPTESQDLLEGYIELIERAKAFVAEHAELVLRHNDLSAGYDDVKGKLDRVVTCR